MAKLWSPLHFGQTFFSDSVVRLFKFCTETMDFTLGVGLIGMCVLRVCMLRDISSVSIKSARPRKNPRNKSNVIDSSLCSRPLNSSHSRSLDSSRRRHKSGLSYIHHVGQTPLRHIPLGVTLSEAAERWPGRPAVISCHENRSLTFAELLQESDKLAASLRVLGLQTGDRFGIWLPNYTQWMVAMMTAARSGLISVAINHAYGKHEMEYALRKVGVKALLAAGSRIDGNYYRILTEVIPELSRSKPGGLSDPHLKELKSVILVGDEDSPGTLNYEKLIQSATPDEINRIQSDMNRVIPDSPCNIQYTSGTTGNPKAAVISHHSIVNNGYAVGLRNELDCGYKKICVQVPLFHVYGVVMSISAAIQHGATIVLPSPKYSPKSNLDALLTEKCNVIHGTPTMYIDLVNEARRRGVSAGAGAGAALRTEIAVTGAATVTPQLVRDMTATLNVDRVKSAFGMTESTAVSFQSLQGEDRQRPLRFLGHLQDHLEAKVVDDTGNMVPFGHPGELQVRGYSTMIGYWGDDVMTKETIGEDGWLRTGDQVLLYEDGYSEIKGRLKDIIIRGGENIAPKEIEDVMSTHPDVLECQVFAVSDDRLNEEVYAAVRMREGAAFDPKQLTSHVAATLAKYKVPRVIKKVDSFPKTASGKVQKFKLRNMVESGQL